MKRFIQNKILPATALLILAVAGCDRDNVKVYHVDSSDSNPPTPPPVTAPTTMPTTMPAGLPAPDNSGQPQLKYVLPAGWQEKTASQMRVASFEISENGKTADVSVIPLGGMAGGDFANINRWRGQVNLQPLADDDLHALAEKISVGDQPADLYDVASDTQRIVGVILHRDDTAWFFKMTGDANLVEKQKPAFVSFLKTLQFIAPATAPALNNLGTQNSLVPTQNTMVIGATNSSRSDK